MIRFDVAQEIQKHEIHRKYCSKNSFHKEIKYGNEMISIKIGHFV